MKIRILGAVVASASLAWSVFGQSDMSLVLGSFLTALGAAGLVFGDDR